MTVLQAYLGANKKKHLHKRQAHKKVARRANRSKLNDAQKRLQGGKYTNLSTATQNTAKSVQLSTPYTKKLSILINDLIPYWRTKLLRALIAEHSSQPVTTNGHISSRVQPVFFDTDTVEIKVDTGWSYSMSGTENDFLKGTITPVSTNTTVARASRICKCKAYNTGKSRSNAAHILRTEIIGISEQTADHQIRLEPTVEENIIDDANQDISENEGDMYQNRPSFDSE
jgi:hypothetical protein